MKMIKVKVLRTFNDKQEKVLQQVGKIIEVTEERYEEIIAVEGEPLIELVEVTESSAKTIETETPVDLNGTVEAVNSLITSDLGKENLELLLKQEQEGNNRKGVIKHIDQLLKEDE